MGDNVGIDDFTVVSIQSKSFFGRNVHVGSGSKIISSLGIELYEYSGISINCILLGDTDDFSGGYLTNPTCPSDLRNVMSEKVILEPHCVVAAGSSMLPGARLLEGSVLGSHSTLTKVSDEWKIYLGNPARAIKERKRFLDSRKK